MSGRPGVVLVVDDSPVARRVLVRALEARGFTVDARESLAAARDAGPAACAILDLELPDGDGVAVAEHLRRLDPGVPLAFFSGGAPPELLTRAGALGPVFDKARGEGDVTAWVVAQLQRPAP